MALTFQLGISSVDAITIYPTYGSSFAEKQLKSEIVTQSGRRYLYKWGDHDLIKLSVDFVSNANASIINSWWDTNTELLFFINSSTATEVHSVLMTNRTQPLAKYEKPYTTYLKGTIQLEGY